jgi:hydrogenase maturation protease
MIRVLCLGNELARDDGIGIRVGRVLRSLPLPDGLEVVLRPALGFESLDDCQGCDELIVVDAASTGEAPGSCQVRELEALAPSVSPFGSTHALGLRQLVEVAWRLGSWPSSIHVITVEAESFEPNSVDLGPRVAAALPRAVDLVLDLVGASEALRDLGREQAARWARCLTVEELLGGGG